MSSSWPNVWRTSDVIERFDAVDLGDDEVTVSGVDGGVALTCVFFFFGAGLRGDLAVSFGVGKVFLSDGGTFADGFVFFARRLDETCA